MIEKLKKIIMDKINAYPPNKKNLAVRAELASVHEFIENHECGWISVKDELPPDDEYVLVYVYGQIKVYFYAVSDDGQERCHWWEDEGGSFHSDITDGDVTHWMPLPSPPKEMIDD